MALPIFFIFVILHAQIAHLLKSIIVQACSIIFLRSSFQWGVNSSKNSDLQLHFRINLDRCVMKDLPFYRLVWISAVQFFMFHKYIFYSKAAALFIKVIFGNLGTFCCEVVGIGSNFINLLTSPLKKWEWPCVIMHNWEVWGQID